MNEIVASIDSCINILQRNDLFSTWPYRQFHMLPDLLDSQVAMLNYYPHASLPNR